MKANLEQQRAVLELAHIDATLAKLDHQISTLPEIVELKELTISANGSRDLRIAAETELKDVQRELSRAEGDVEQIVSRIERDEKRLNSGQGAPKELEQLQHELGTLAQRRKELEEIELEIMLRIDDIKVRINALSGEEAAFQQKISDTQVRKENSLNALTKEHEISQSDRTRVITGISAELLAIYEKARADRGVGAAALVGGKCTGCNLTINAVELNRIKSLPEDDVVRCEECRCILVRAQ